MKSGLLTKRIIELILGDETMKVGDKISFELSSYEMTACWDTPFGLVYLYTFKDFFQNIFIWKTSRLIDFDISKVTGTIKEKINYNGLEEIVLNYCRVK